MNRALSTRTAVEIALTIALSVVLQYFRLWAMPMGGVVSLGMLPILVLAVRRGVVPGMIAGALFGFVDLTIEPYILTWAQVLLDYPLAFGALGLAGLGASAWRSAVLDGRQARAVWTVAAPWITFGVLGRFLCHFVSGVVFFASAAPKGTPVAVYSALYNATYLVPSLLLALVPALILLPVLERAVPASGRTVPAR